MYKQWYLGIWAMIVQLGLPLREILQQGENSFFGEFLINAQGEDVVAGTRTPQYITKKAKQDAGSNDPSMEEAMPKVYKELQKYFLN
jgi:phosphoenolpyruvate synthase/pyruvate phosphate dikinase